MNEVMEKFKFGTVNAPDGRAGDWAVSTFALTAEDVMMANLRAARDGNFEMICDAGTYKRLTHRTRGCIMSNTRMEIRTAAEAYSRAKGNVLVNGLGLGMVLEGMLAKDVVTHVTVIELSQDVIDLVGPQFKDNPRVTIICADAYTWKAPKGAHYDYVWHGIWDDISEDNLPGMAKLCRKYGRRATEQGVWSRYIVRRNKRRGW